MIWYQVEREEYVLFAHTRAALLGNFAKCLVIKSLNHKAAPIEFPSADSVEVQ